MKITSSRLDDVRMEKEAYERDYTEKLARYDQEYSSYWNAQREILDNIEAALLQQINARTSQEIEVSATQDYSYRYPQESYVKVRVKAEDRAWPLQWTWEASISPDTGEVVKESNSYSGIEATTPENIRLLRESLDVMDYLVNKVDWNTLLHTQLPNKSDYIKSKQPERRNFDKAEADALIADCIGEPILVKCAVTGDTYIKDSWVKFISQTSLFYNVITISSSYSAEDLEDNYAEASKYSYPQRISKTKIQPVKPFETVEIRDYA